jgi:site-specific recombinase XerD
MMLRYFYDSELRLRQLGESPLAEQLEGFAGWLASAGYKRGPGQAVIRGAAHLGDWLSARGVSFDQLDRGLIDSFVGHVRRCQCNTPFRGRGRTHAAGARRLFEYLRSIGVLLPTEAEADSALVARFADWMRQYRGVTESSLASGLPLVREFFEALGDDTAAYDASSVRAFVLARASRHGHSRAAAVVGSVRMFLRFLAMYGHCPLELVAAVPTVAGWKLSSLPRYIGADDIERLVAVCDPATPGGARDRAVILLLARLGLRAADVRDLCLGDIDWSQGKVRVMGKGRVETWLPLPQDVGDAVLCYLENARPAIDDDRVFLRVHAPITPFRSSGSISKLVCRAIRRAGIETPSMGAHLLRHSAATEMLRQGASLDLIGAVLRHRCVDTTDHYAKVDFTELSVVAQPWPVEGGSSC